MLLFCIIMIGSISYIRKGSNFGTNWEKVIKCAPAMLCCWKTNGLRGLPGVFGEYILYQTKWSNFGTIWGKIICVRAQCHVIVK